MIGISRNTAEIEYAVMLAVLNFQSQFMKSSYQQARVDVSDDVIHVTLTKTNAIPAEERLAQSPEGRALLEEVHTELFRSGEALLRVELERALGAAISSLSSRLDTAAGTSTITVKLAER
ncbi:Na-translocating system protein MpsC family protein [Nitrospira moscoviensis]|uniref:Na+-translocating membrane potential-generating system MpsC domain-containing protein n=1 Tax=Nitrospira moscoviensis TaxID=42253 RepID=A0A0K2GFF7_NITMO|nr:Na-translocating system protein MpsC family protein [Nitrospira moscoviensis]ALA59686.1 hypothetical protein NITMOv2_3293 [Nitrospira moscoviensis]